MCFMFTYTLFFFLAPSYSAAILKYLCLRYTVPEHWCPSQLRDAIRLDEYLAWHHTNTLPHTQAIYMSQVVACR